MSTDFHIGISYQDDVPAEFINEFTQSVSAPNFEVLSEPRERGVYASIEWAIPTLVIAYLTKPYFEAFLQEAGKDHYQVLKKSTLRLFGHLFSNNPELRNQKRSLLFSAMAKTQDGRSLKFVFPEGIAMDQYERALDLLHILLSQHYESFPNDPISEMANKLTTPSHSLYIEFVPDEANWVLIDPFIEAHNARKAQAEHNKQPKPTP